MKQKWKAFHIYDKFFFNHPQWFKKKSLSESKVLLYFGSIWGTIQHLWMLLPRSWKWQSVAREIMHVAAQSVHECVWHIKWDQGERNGWLGKSNSHPPDRELCLTSRLPTHWRACKLLHCTIDPDVAFWYDDSNPAWMHKRKAFWKV